MSIDPNHISRFFSLSIREGEKKSYTVTDHPFLVISNASLNIPVDTATFLSKPTRLFVNCQTHTDTVNQSENSNSQIHKSSICIATLVPQTNEHCCLDFKIYESEIVEFEVIGPYQIDIIGYFSIPESENGNNDSDSELMRKISMLYDKEEEEEEEEMINTSDLEAAVSMQYEKEEAKQEQEHQ